MEPNGNLSKSKEIQRKLADMQILAKAKKKNNGDLAVYDLLNEGFKKAKERALTARRTL